MRLRTNPAAAARGRGTRGRPITATAAWREFQVAQRGDGILLRLVLADDAAPSTPRDVARAISERLAKLGIADPHVEEVICQCVRQ